MAHQSDTGHGKFNSYWLLVATSVIGAAAGLVLFGVRAESVLSLSVPIQVQTTGDEFTNLFNIWKAAKGQEIYSDRFRIPYSVAQG